MYILKDIQMMAELIHESDIAGGMELGKKETKIYSTRMRWMLFLV